MAVKMRKFAIITGIVLLILGIQSCAGSAAAKNADIADIREKDWILDEVKTGTASVKINRTGSTNEVFTLKLDAERISGVAAPNRYFGPYTAGEKQALTVGMMAGTMMAPLFEREDLKEQDYMKYLEKINRWKLNNGKLELYTVDGSGKEAVLIYIEK